jgi:hypothetical protein
VECDEDSENVWVYEITDRNSSWTVPQTDVRKIHRRLTTLHKYLCKLYFLNKELQAEEIDWTDVQYELTRTRNSINNIKDEDIFIESKEISGKTGDPLALCDTMPIHNTSH